MVRLNVGSSVPSTVNDFVSVSGNEIVSVGSSVSVIVRECSAVWVAVSVISSVND